MTSGSGWSAAATVAAGLLIGLGVAIAGFAAGQGLVEMRRADRTVTVKGLAERDVTADSAAWRIPFRGVGDTRRAAIAEARSAQSTVRGFAIAAGLSEDEVLNEPFSLRIERRTLARGGEQVEVDRYLAVGAVRVRTRRIEAVAAMTERTSELLDAGVLLGADDYGATPAPEYRFTGLNAIKPELIADATRAARASAAQFAEDSGSALGGIASANQGVILIVARDGGVSEREARDKRVRVVSTVRYYLED